MESLKHVISSSESNFNVLKERLLPLWIRKRRERINKEVTHVSFLLPSYDSCYKGTL